MKKKKKVPQAGSTGHKRLQPVQSPSVPATAFKQPSPTTTNGFKTFILLATSITSLFIFFGLPPYKRWFNERIIPYWEDFQEQRLNLNLEERKLSRYQVDYEFALNVSDFFEKRGIINKSLVLIPPSGYFNAHGLHIHVVEPTVFYYFTGLKTIWPNSPEANKANWYITARNGRLIFNRVTDQQAFRDTIASFNSYKTSL